MLVCQPFYGFERRAVLLPPLAQPAGLDAQLVGYLFYRSPRLGEVNGHPLEGGVEYTSFHNSQI